LRNFTITDSSSDLVNIDYFIICVPTGLNEDGQPELQSVRNASHLIGRALGRGSTVVMESTSFPGTTRDIVQPILEKESGLKAGHEFYLGFASERVDVGNDRFTYSSIPKVISGINDDSTVKISELYSTIVDKLHLVADCETAELSKLIENTYRLVNISLVNELMMLSEKSGWNFFDALDAASTKPFGFQKFNPGPGIGGLVFQLTQSI